MKRFTVLAALGAAAVAAPRAVRTQSAPLRIAWAETNDPAYVQPVLDLMSKYAILAKNFPARELFAPQIT